MNFDDAIKAHAGWKLKLAAYLNKPDKSLDPDVVACDDKCDLGKWIYGEGKAHVALPQYGTLKVEHAGFHRAASDVVKKAHSGQKVSEDIALGASSPFALASSKVVSAIMAMKASVK